MQADDDLQYTESDMTRIKTKTKKSALGSFESPNRGVIPREKYTEAKAMTKVYSPSSNGRITLKQTQMWQVQSDKQLADNVNTMSPQAAIEKK